jgi:hypothetical protein
MTIGHRRSGGKSDERLALSVERLLVRVVSMIVSGGRRGNSGFLHETFGCAFFAQNLFAFICSTILAGVVWTHGFFAILANRKMHALERIMRSTASRIRGSSTMSRKGHKLDVGNWLLDIGNNS